jgi:hypothetical protein
MSLRKWKDAVLLLRKERKSIERADGLSLTGVVVLGKLAKDADTLTF